MAQGKNKNPEDIKKYVMRLIYRSRKPEIICDPKVAYSLRKCVSAYTGDCIRVRRSSDNAELDIGFDTGILDTAALLTFCGSGDGFITTWYDQSGNGINAVQTTTTRQPVIVTGGVISTMLTKPTVSFNGSTHYFDIPYLSYSGSKLTLFEVAQKLSTDTVNNSSRFFSTYSDSTYDFSSLGSFVVYANIRPGTNYIGNMRNSVQVTQSYTAGDIVLIYAGYDGCRRKIALNGSTLTTSAFSGGFSYTKGRIGALINSTGGANAGNFLGGNISELILFHCDRTADKVTIENEINTFYSIY